MAVSTHHGHVEQWAIAGGRERLRTALRAGCALLLVMGLACGCRTTGGAADDAEVRRHAEAAHKAFSNGYEEDAIRRYRRAVRRAWAIDNATLIGRHAYNLAAAYAAVGRYGEARDWLAEARAEMIRAGDDALKTHILEAHVARQQGFLFEARSITDTVARAVHADGGRLGIGKHKQCTAGGARTNGGCRAAGGWHADHAESGGPLKALARRLESIEPKQPEERHDHARKKLEKRTSEVQVHLLRAELAADQFDLQTANEELSAARRKMRPRMDRAVAAELQRVTGRVEMLSGRYGPAGARFDDEARLLRLAKSYRGIPQAYRSAAEAYEMAGLFGMAVDRYVRAARMLYARETFLPALWCIDRALPLALGNRELEGRLAVVFHEIAHAVEERSAESNQSEPTHTVPSTDSPHEPIHPMPERPAPHNGPDLPMLPEHLPPHAGQSRATNSAQPLLVPSRSPAATPAVNAPAAPRLH